MKKRKLQKNVKLLLNHGENLNKNNVKKEKLNQMLNGIHGELNKLLLKQKKNQKHQIHMLKKLHYQNKLLIIVEVYYQHMVQLVQKKKKLLNMLIQKVMQFQVQKKNVVVKCIMNQLVVKKEKKVKKIYHQKNFNHQIMLVLINLILVILKLLNILLKLFLYFKH